MTRVVIVQELMAQYRVPFYEYLREGLTERGIQLQVLYGQAPAARATRRDEARLAWGSMIRNRSLGPFVWQPVWRSVRGADLVVVEQANRLLLNYLLVVARRLRMGPRVAFWGHGADLQASGRPLRQAIKRRSSRWPDWWFAYTRGSAERVVDAGFARHKITVVQNSVDAREYEGVDLERVDGQFVFLGSLHEHKRLEFLLDAASLVAQRVPNFSLMVAGNGPCLPVVSEAESRFPWLHHVGAVFGDEKARLICSSQAILLPGLVGLAVIESFLAGTPVVTTAYRFQSPEFEYLEHDVNAIVLERDASVADYATEIMALLTDAGHLEKLRVGCALAKVEYGLQNSVERFADGIIEALSAA